MYNTESVTVRLVLNAYADEQTGEVCITRYKSFLRAGASVHNDALLHLNYNKHCFSKENFTVPKYNT